MNSILAIVHQETSDPALVGDVLRSRGYELDLRAPSLGDPLPETLEDRAGAIVFGGPMSANDDHKLDFIRQELDWIPTALDSGKPFLGICLGAQMLARVLGATVAPHPEGLREIGFFPIYPEPAAQPHFDRPRQVYHWHQEGFALPSGTVPLAAGDRFAHQAFRYGDRAYGLQFHPEADRDLVAAWTVRGAEHLSRPGAQSRREQLAAIARHEAEGRAWLEGFIDDWLAA